MLAFSFVLTSLAITALAAPAPRAEVFEASSAVSFDVGAFPTASWYAEWRSAWLSYHYSHHGSHHATEFGAATSSIATASSASSPSVDTSSPSTSASPSSAPSSSVSSTSAPASTPTPVSSSAPSSSAPSSSSTISASSSVTPSATQSMSQATPSLSASAASYLDPHNTLRAKHTAQPLTWSDDLAAAAQTWANKCQWAHSGGAVGNYGENIAAGTGNFDATSAVAAWASEESQYDPSNPVYSHFTQMVWKGTTQLGCAVASCPGLINADVAEFHVCEYNPAGNIEGQFSENVS